jgi:hypothetical protein
MLMEEQNFHYAKKRIVVCVLFMGKYFLLCTIKRYEDVGMVVVSTRFLSGRIIKNDL